MMPDKHEMARIPAISKAQRTRLRFIETVLAWEGRLNRKRVTDVFGVSANHVTNDLRLYKKLCPRNVEYDVSSRTYRAATDFNLVFSSADAVREYLSLLRTGAEGARDVVISLGGNTDIGETLPCPITPIDAPKLMLITRAINECFGLAITYQSLTDSSPKIRNVWPHALVFAGTRWHMRCYDGLKEDFRDFSLPRIRDIEKKSERCPRALTDDVGWNEKVLMQIVPNPRLSESQAEVVALEYGMTRKRNRSQWSPEVRRCLVPYMVKRYGLVDRGDPKTLPIVLANKEDFKDLLFPEPE